MLRTENITVFATPDGNFMHVVKRNTKTGNPVYHHTHLTYKGTIVLAFAIQSKVENGQGTIRPMFDAHVGYVWEK